MEINVPFKIKELDVFYIVMVFLVFSSFCFVCVHVLFVLFWILFMALWNCSKQEIFSNISIWMTELFVSIA